MIGGVTSRHGAKWREFPVSIALSSWKEIATYMGKGVRTVQRWEDQFGLPVRRPHAKSHVIFALPEELDAWIKSHRQAPNNHPVKAIAINEERRVEQIQLMDRLKTSYARLEKNEQLLGRNITRLLSAFQEAAVRTSRLRNHRSSNRQNGQAGDNAA
jgi:hypothetical protein